MKETWKNRILVQVAEKDTRSLKIKTFIRNSTSVRCGLYTKPLGNQSFRMAQGPGSPTGTNLYLVEPTILNVHWIDFINKIDSQVLKICFKRLYSDGLASEKDEGLLCFPNTCFIWRNKFLLTEKQGFIEELQGMPQKDLHLWIQVLSIRNRRCWQGGRVYTQHLSGNLTSGVKVVRQLYGLEYAHWYGRGWGQPYENHLPPPPTKMMWTHF